LQRAMAVPGFIVIVCLAYDSRGYGNYTYICATILKFPCAMFAAV